MAESTIGRTLRRRPPHLYFPASHVRSPTLLCLPSAALFFKTFWNTAHYLLHLAHPFCICTSSCTFYSFISYLPQSSLLHCSSSAATLGNKILMQSRIVLALLLALLLEPVAATSPAMEAALPVVSMASSYPDPDGMLSGFCGVCQSFDFCFCTNAMVSPLYGSILQLVDGPRSMPRAEHLHSLQSLQSLQRRSSRTPNGPVTRGRYSMRHRSQNQRQNQFRRTSPTVYRCST